MKNNFIKKRILAWTIDFTPYIIIFGILFVVGIGGGLSNSGPSEKSVIVFHLAISLLVIIFLIQAFYYFKDGQTLGYKFVKLKIVNKKEDEKKMIFYKKLFFRFWLKYGAVLFGLCFLFPLCIVYVLIELYFIFIKKDDLYDKFTKLKIISLEMNSI